MLEEFYGDVLPDKGNYALWTKSNKHNSWYSTAPDLLAATDAYVQMGTLGVYFATAAYNDRAVANGNKDARTQANVCGKKCFYVDLDAGSTKLTKHGPDKVYEDQREALRSVLSFARSTSMVPTYIVSSGDGLHVYWCLEDTVAENHWSFAARKFAALLREYGVKADPAVTTDSSRVLRPLGTRHENGTEVRVLTRRGPIYGYDRFLGLVGDLVTSEQDDLPPPPESMRREESINDDVLVKGPPKSIRKIAPKCAALADVIRKRGNVSEPLWRAMIGLVKFTVEGAKAAHAFSAGHPDYTRAETDRKFDNWTAGPTSCSEFAKHCDHCEGCPQQGKIKSPIVLGAMNDEEVSQLPPEKQPQLVQQDNHGKPWDGAIPKGYFITDDGVLIGELPVTRKDEDGNFVTEIHRVPITQDIFWLTQWADAHGTSDSAQMFLHKWTGSAVKEYTFEQELVANQQKLREALARRSIITSSHPKANHAMESYIKAQLALVKSSPSRFKINDRLGMYVAEDGELMCSHGEFIIRQDGTIHKALMGSGSKVRDIAQAFTIPLPYSARGEWDATVWEEHVLPKARKHVEFLRKHYRHKGLEKYRLAIMLGMASPFLAFTNGDYRSGQKLNGVGLAVSLYSAESGRGKTTAIHASMLAYGVPTALSADHNEIGATALGRIESLVERGTMPIGMDEMGELSAGPLASMISAIGNGTGRVRAQVRGGTTTAPKFALIALLAANKSARDMVAAARSESSAIQYRMLELDVDGVPEFDAEQNNQFRSDWIDVQDCAGALGSIIHRAMCSMGVDGLNVLTAKCTSEARNLIEGNQQSGRFQYRGLGAAMTLQLVLKRLGLEIFDWDELLATFQEAHDNGALFVNENTLPTDGLSLLHLALHDLTPHTAVTLDLTRRSRYVTNYDEPMVPMPQVVKARHVVGSRLTYVSSQALREWANDKRVAFAKIISAARANGVISTIYGTAAKAQTYNLLMGMRGNTESCISCYCFDVGRLTQITGRTMTPERPEANSNVVRLTLPEPAQPPAEEGSSATV